MIQISSKQGHPPGGAELSSSQDYCFSCRATAAPRPLFTQTGHEDSHANVMLEQHPEYSSGQALSNRRLWEDKCRPGDRNRMCAFAVSAHGGALRVGDEEGRYAFILLNICRFCYSAKGLTLLLLQSMCGAMDPGNSLFRAHHQTQFRLHSFAINQRKISLK